LSKRPGRNKKTKPEPRKGQGNKAKGIGKSRSNKNTGSPAVPGVISRKVKHYLALAEASKFNQVDTLHIRLTRVTVAALEPNMEIPPWVTHMIDEVIVARKKFASWYSPKAVGDASSDINESNSGHQYFITILEKVFSVLTSVQQLAIKPTASRKGKEVDITPVEQNKNIFELLESEADTEHTMTEPLPLVAKV
jgi:hypothetical protein